MRQAKKSFVVKQNSPELVICVPHLVCSEFRHQDFDDVDEDQEVDLTQTETQSLTDTYAHYYVQLDHGGFGTKRETVK